MRPAPLLALVVLAACAAPDRREPPAAPSPPRTRRFELRLSARIAHPTSATYDVRVPLPPREAGQDIVKLSAEVLPGEGGFEFARDASGNRQLHVRRRGDDGRPIEVNVTLLIETTERRLTVAPLRELTDVERRALANELDPTSPASSLEEARALVAAQRRRTRDPFWLIQEARLGGVPARRVRGLGLPVGRAAAWTEATQLDWTEVFLGGTGWVALDPCLADVGLLLEDRLVLARGEPPSEPFKTAGGAVIPRALPTRPRVEVDGKPLGAAETKVLVRDL